MKAKLRNREYLGSQNQANLEAQASFVVKNKRSIEVIKEAERQNEEFRKSTAPLSSGIQSRENYISAIVNQLTSTLKNLEGYIQIDHLLVLLDPNDKKIAENFMQVVDWILYQISDMSRRVKRSEEMIIQALELKCEKKEELSTLKKAIPFVFEKKKLPISQQTTILRDFDANFGLAFPDMRIDWGKEGCIFSKNYSLILDKISFFANCILRFKISNTWVCDASRACIECANQIGIGQKHSDVQDYLIKFRSQINKESEKRAKKAEINSMLLHQKMREKFKSESTTQMNVSLVNWIITELSMHILLCPEETIETILSAIENEPSGNDLDFGERLSVQIFEKFFLDFQSLSENFQQLLWRLEEQNEIGRSRYLVTSSFHPKNNSLNVPNSRSRNRLKTIIKSGGSNNTFMLSPGYKTGPIPTGQNLSNRRKSVHLQPVSRHALNNISGLAHSGTSVGFDGESGDSQRSQVSKVIPKSSNVSLISLEENFAVKNETLPEQKGLKEKRSPQLILLKKKPRSTSEDHCTLNIDKFDQIEMRKLIYKYQQQARKTSDNSQFMYNNIARSVSALNAAKKSIHCKPIVNTMRSQNRSAVTTDKTPNTASNTSYGNIYATVYLKKPVTYRKNR